MMKKLSLSDTPFNLALSVSCGQAFRWHESNGVWSAPVGNAVWHVAQKGDMLYYSGASEEEIIHYFALDRDLDEILADIDRDELIHQAVVKCRGLRILRQPKWECLVSYICATCANIPGIRMRIENLSRRFGKPLDDGYYSFPTPEELSAPINEIRCCKVGYRDAYICDAVNQICKTDFLERVAHLSYSEAKTELMQIKGVGQKVADCVLLFSFEKYEAVPVDVWIERILRTKYIGSEKKLSYAKAEEFAQIHFGRYAGYAQEYLFGMRELIAEKGE